MFKELSVETGLEVMSTNCLLRFFYSVCDVRWPTFKSSRLRQGKKNCDNNVKKSVVMFCAFLGQLR